MRETIENNTELVPILDISALHIQNDYLNLI